MADVLSFGAMYFTAAQKVELLDKFDNLYNNGGYSIFASKQTYHSDDENYKPFDYKLIIRTTDSKEFFGEDDFDYRYTNVYIELLMCPLPEFLSKKTVDKMKDYFDVDELDIHDIRVLMECGFWPYLGYDEVAIPEDDNIYNTYNILNVGIVKEKLDCAATAAEACSSIRGFLLDKSWGWMDDAGWNQLDELIKETGPIENIVKRFKDIIKHLKNGAA